MKRFVGSLMALSLLTAGAAFAVPQQHNDNDHDRDRNAQRYDETTSMALTAVMIIAMTGMTTGATIATTHIMTITAMARRIGAASVWQRTTVATALPTTTSTMSSQRRAGTNGVVWITPAC